MQWNKHFAWVWAAAGLFAVTSTLGACEPKAGPRTRGEGSNHSTPRTGRDQGVTFLEGMGPSVEGLAAKPRRVTLTKEPRQYTIAASRVSNAKPVGGC